jgi:hypothetical protein
MPKKSKSKPKSKKNIVNDEEEDNDNDNENILDDGAVDLKILSKKVLRIQKDNINIENKKFVLNNGVVCLSVY